jgi:hypothetical protein
LVPLIDPAKLATLGKRGANPRLQKAVAILEEARRDSVPVAYVASNAVALVYTNALLAQLTRESLVNNHNRAMFLYGVLNTNGLADMKNGQSPTITQGSYTGRELTVDYVVPVSIAPELDNIIANLQFLPDSSSNEIGQRASDYAVKFREAGLITQSRVYEVQRKQTRIPKF